jgi:cysteine desulfurase
VNLLERLYLDYNATSPLSISVLDWLRSGDVLFANPSSQHSDGKSARKSVNEARTLLFKTFHKSESDTKLFFHSGATEGIHTFASSFAEAARLSGRDLLICYSKVDHPAVGALSERYFGPHVKFFELARDKNLHYLHKENAEALKDKKDNNPDLMILYHHLWVHNETGQVSPLSELTVFKQIPDLYLHIDAVQAPGKIPEWRDLSAGDIWTFSAHKFGALKGIGFSFFKNTTPFHALIMGGSQQNNLRSGTENTQGIKSIALALTDLIKVDVKQNSLMREKLLSFMVQELKGIGEVISDNTDMASNTIYFYLNTLTSDIALALFDIHGVEISAGSACSSGAAKSSAVLLQKGLLATAKNGLRLSMPFTTDEESLNKVQSRLKPIFNKLRQN